MSYMNSFLVGFHASEWVPNYSVCTGNIMKAGVSLNNTSKFFDDTNHVWYEKALNLSGTISAPVANAF